MATPYQTANKSTVPPSGSPTSGSQKTHNSPTQKSKPHSQGKKPFNTRPSSGKGESRSAKRARWAKRAKPVARPVAPRRENAYEYISACCSLPARKPRAGMKETVKDPETGKMKDKPKGLGHWRCSGCGKNAKVRPQKPQPKVTYTAEQMKTAVEKLNSLSVVPVAEVPTA